MRFSFSLGGHTVMTYLSDLWHEWSWLIALLWGFGLLVIWIFFEREGRDDGK